MADVLPYVLADVIANVLWQMLLPCLLYYIIFGGRCYSHKEDVASFFNNLADVIVFDIVTDVITTLVAYYNSWLAGVICQVADGIATCYNRFLAGVICQVADGIAI